MNLTRRDILAGIPGLIGGYAIAKIPSARADERPFRIAHLTDLHIQPGSVAEQGVTKALDHAQSQGVDLIINGGDVIYDALKESPDSIDSQWKALARVLERSCHTPMINVLGNHDIAGWATPERKIDSKQRALERLGLESSYYSVEKGGWKILILDSIGWAPERGSGYVAALGEEQFQWLGLLLQSFFQGCSFREWLKHLPLISLQN